MLLQAFGDGDKGPDEHSGIPAIVATVEIFQCFVEICFSTNCSARKKAVLRAWLRWAGRFSYADIAVTGGWLRRLDADRDDGLPAPREIKCVGQHLLELLFLRYDVVGGRTAIVAVGERAPTSAAPRVTAAVVSRPIGSATTFSLQLRELFLHLGRLGLG
jgi:hypothetical protein